MLPLKLVPLGYEQKFPSNKELGLHLQKKERTEIPSDAILSKVKHAITKSIIEFEIFFGLTKSESIKLPAYSIMDDHIMIYRKIAYNSYDRIIPITEEQQRKVLNKRMQIINNYGGRNCLLQVASFQELSNLYRSELAILNIKGHSSFRKLYAKNRFTDLIQNCKRAEAINILQKELGLTSNIFLKEWINEQD